MTNFVLRAFTRLFRFSRRINTLDQRVRQLQRQHATSINVITKHAARIEYLRAELDSETEKARHAMSNATVLNEKMAVALEAARDQVTTFREITVPGLVAANKCLINRWESESQVYAMRMAINNREPNE